MLIKGLLLTLYMLRWSLELLLIYIEVPVPSHQNTSSWFWNCSQSVVVFFLTFYHNIWITYKQLDNLEHSVHLYGQLTTVGLFELFRLTIVWSFTTFGQFTEFEPFTTFGQFTIFGPFTTFGLLTILWSFKTFGSFTIFGQFTTFGSLQIFGQCITCFYRIFHTYNLYKV